MSYVRCAHCGGNVYEYGPPAYGFGMVVSRITGCTTFSCYNCGRHGWLRNGQSGFRISMLARMAQGLIILLAVLVTAFILFGVLMR